MAGHTSPYDVKYKVLLVGDSGVGKTALIKSLQGHKFNPNLRATVGVDFIEKLFHVDGCNIQLQIWDTAGQERFRTITRFQYRGTKGLLLVYDVTSKSSFSMINYWLDSIDKEIDQNNKEPIPVFIIGNKCDLEHQRVISYEQGQKLAESTYVRGFLETSAKEAVNVIEAFNRLATSLTEINHPKAMNSYLTPEQRHERVARQMGKLFYSPQRKASTISLTLTNLQLAIKEKANKCPCG